MASKLTHQLLSDLMLRNQFWYSKLLLFVIVVLCFVFGFWCCFGFVFCCFFLFFFFSPQVFVQFRIQISVGILYCVSFAYFILCFLFLFCMSVSFSHLMHPDFVL